MNIYVRVQPDGIFRINECVCTPYNADFDGDEINVHVRRNVVLFYRQPLFHKQKMMAHRVRVRPDGTFRVNGCVCSLYNADFDSNEVNIQVP